MIKDKLDCVERFSELVKSQKNKEAREYYFGLRPEEQREIEKKAGLWLKVLKYSTI